MTEIELKSGMYLNNGAYRIERTLGQGGFGITYVAEQVSLGRKVAVKEFYMKELCNRDDGSHVSVPSTGSKELVGKFREKFVREARMLAGFDHNSIVRVIDVFEENGTAYYVMKYLEGGSLQSLTERRGRLGEEEALKYIREIAGALDYIHSRDTLHLDVKPGNIMLDNDGRAVLIDFGISKHVDVEGHLTSSTPLGVSRGYAPLEQVAQEASSTYSAATDIYSLGATLYFLLTGKRPPEPSALVDGFPIGELESSGVSSGTISAIKAAMQVSKKNRPQSIEEFLALLAGKTEGGYGGSQEGASGDDKTVTYGTLRVSSRPDDAKIFIDGRQTGSTKGSLEIKLEPGTHIVRIEKGGYEPYERSVSIVAGRTVEVKAELERKKPVISVAAIISCIVAAMLVAGLFLWRPWKPQQDVTDDTDTVLVAQTDSSTAAGITDIPAVRPQQPQPAPDVEERKGSVKIISEPSGAGIWIDGKDTGLSTNDMVEDLKTGRHSIKLVLEGYETYTGTIDVKEGRTSMNFKLKEKPQPAPDVEERKGSVKIISEPSGAGIWIDGKDTGLSTNDIVEGLKIGNHSIKLVLEGYETYTGAIDVKEGRTSMSFKLKEKPKPVQPQQTVQQTSTTTNTETSSSGKINGHEYVDLGLSVKWATCNVGATSPEGYGDYFAWGETSPKSSYDWTNLKYCTEGDSYDNVKFSKYVGKRKYGIKDSRTRLELSDDAARANWGGSWRMPTKSEQDELMNQCSWQWTSVNGHNGYRVTSKRNGRSIFLPAAGSRNGSSSDNVGSRGGYWSSSLGSSLSYSAYNLSFSSSSVGWLIHNRRYGLSVRAVSE